MLLLMVSILSLFCHKKSKAQNCIITGNLVACVGSNVQFSIQSPNSNNSYIWAVSGNSNNTPPTTTPNIGTNTNIYFATSGTYTVNAVSSSSTTTATTVCTKVVKVVNAPQPFISPLSFGACTDINPEQPTCYSVCQNTLIKYTPNLANASDYLGLPNSFQVVNDWNVVGGVFTNNNSTNFTGNNPEVLWDNNLGLGSINLTCKLVLNGQILCSTVYSACVQKVATPEALFTMSLDPINPVGCLGEIVNFTNLSSPLNLGSPNANIISWEWDLGDGTTSIAKTPQHQYLNAGSYNVTLKATNGCGCSSVYKLPLTIVTEVGPVIFCQAPSCYQQFQKFSTNQICAPYQWSCDVGDIYVGGINYGNSYNGPSNEIFVKWVGVSGQIPNGFGNVTLNGSTCTNVGCTGITTLMVPVVSPQGNNVFTCINSDVVINAPEWPATDFSWQISSQLGTNASITSQIYNDKTVSINTGSNIGIFVLEGAAKNTLTGCEQIVTYRFVLSNKPTITNIASKICIGMNLNPVLDLGLVNSLNGAITWELNGNNQTTTFTGNLGSNTITIPTNTMTPGFYQLTAKSNAATPEFCEPELVYFEIKAKPSPPTIINGKLNVCPLVIYNYSTPAPLTGFQYLWTASPTNIATSSLPAYGSSVNVTWNSAVANKVLSVQKELVDIPGCLSDPYSISLTDANPTATITYATTNTVNVEDCQTQFKLNFTDPTTVADNIFWYVQNSTMGDIVLGQGTNTVTVGWNKFTSTSTPQIKCNYSVCGNSYSLSFNAPVVKSPLLLSINNVTTPGIPSSFCSGVSQSFNFNCNTSFAAPNSYIIEWGDGTSNTIASNSYTASSNHTFTNNSNVIIQYTIKAKVISACNPSIFHVITQIVNVKPQPNANLTYNGTINPCPTDPINVVCSLSSNVVSSFSWRHQPSGSNIPAPYNPIAGTTNTQTIYTISTLGTGNYYVEVTYNGCTTMVGPVSVNTINCSGSSTPCPVVPAGTPPPTPPVVSVTAASTGCGAGSASVSSSVAINNILWSINPLAGVTITSPANGNSSASYSFIHAGTYNIGYEGLYSTLGQLCPISGNTTLNIPLVADFKYGITCNSSNNGYNLKLEDLSSVAANFANSPANLCEWRINNILMPNTAGTIGTIQTYTITPNATYTISLTRKVGTGVGQVCTITKNISIPTIPLANFTAVSTNPSSTATAISTCEFQPLALTNTSTPATSLVGYTWEFSNGGPAFGNNTKDVVKYFEYTSSGNIPYSLTVTDNYGCTAIKSGVITLFDNAYTTLPNQPIPIISNSPIYSVSPLGNGCPPIPNEISLVNFSPLTILNAPLNYKWYNSSNNNSMVQSGSAVNTQGMQYTTSNPGSYWLEFTDSKGCNVKWTTPSANISNITLPPIYITGKPNVCSPFEAVTLKCNVGQLPNGVTIAGYTWSRSPSGNPLTNTATITEFINTNGAIQSFTYNCQVTFMVNGNSCTKSIQYIVTCYPNPEPPNTVVTNISCQPFLATVTASPGGAIPIAGYNFNSNITMPNGQITIPGTYTCVAVTAQGCTNFSTFATINTPDKYMWRIPKGCMEFCEQELPRYINPPYQVNFDDWNWYQFGASLSWPNGSTGWADHGSGYSDPLWVAQAPGIGMGGDGNGEGNYSWNITKDGCTLQSPDWNVTINQNCCTVDIYDSTIQLFCDANGKIVFQFVTHPTINTVAAQIPFNITAVDNSGNPIGFLTLDNIPPAVNTTLTNYINNIVSGSISLINPNSYSGDVNIIIKSFSDAGTCFGKFVRTTTCPIAGKATGSGISPFEVGQVNLVKIYPNPTNTNISIDILTKNVLQEQHTIVISNLMGQTLQKHLITNNHETLDISQLKEGLYIFELRNSANKLVQINKIQVKY